LSEVVVADAASEVRSRIAGAMPALAQG